jgi:hypothetical protein
VERLRNLKPSKSPVQELMTRDQLRKVLDLLSEAAVELMPLLEKVRESQDLECTTPLQREISLAALSV